MQLKWAWTSLCFFFLYFSVWSTEMEIWFPVRWKHSSSIWCQRTSTTRTSHTFLLSCSAHDCSSNRTSFCSKHVISAISSSSWTFISTTITTPSQIRYLRFNDYWLDCPTLLVTLPSLQHWKNFQFDYICWVLQTFLIDIRKWSTYRKVYFSSKNATGKIYLF